MAAGIFNIAKGRLAEYGGLPAAGDEFVWVLMSAAEADATLEDYDDLSTLLAAGGNTEATFTGYARVDATDITVTVDDTSNHVEINAPTDPVFNPTSAQTLVKLLCCYDPTGASADSALVPLFHDDFSTTTATSGTLTYNVATDFMTSA